MIIDFKQLPLQTMKNFWNGEKYVKTHMYIDDKNKIMFGTLIPGASIGQHKHETSSEIIYIIQGKGTVLYDDIVEKISEGMCHYCPKGHTHSFVNDGQEDVIFLAIVPAQ